MIAGNRRRVMKVPDGREMSMRDGKVVAIFGLAALLASCGDAGTAPEPERSQPAKASTSKPNPFHDQLMKLSETDRGLTLRRAVQDNRGSCRRIVSSVYQEEYQGLRMWTLRCEGNRDWAIFVGAAGRVQVRSCGDNVKLGLPVCRFKGA
ncbi:hypothetical protein [Allosphingosinicella vermicomposti]|uniref:hypothetical protein n=1 Tax=Allosphingosinicella vermicomposti TaxID=614671 RepID=UPI001A9CA198|nr:hypothetical protein [Allosphingosinicella vermicomposti]